jgi:DNA-binding CsgD family transcriptional regulator
VATDRPTFPGNVPLLVGREREQAILRGHLAAALTGHGSLILIGGEAGIGKSTLAEGLCQEAMERGALVLIGRCYDLTETPPYGPWLDLFRRYQPSNELPPLPAAFAQREQIGEIASPAALFYQVQDFIAAAAVRRPLVLLLDDLHWADPASLDLLRVVARDVGALPVLIAATYRIDEPAEHHRLPHYLPAMIREANAARLGLQRLTEEDVRALVTGRFALGETEIQRLVAYLSERGEGNPFFMGELMRTLAEEGMLRTSKEGWALGDLSKMRVPPLVRQVIAGRLARLDNEAQRLLAIGAVIGQDIHWALWATVAEEPEDGLLGVVEQAIRAHLLAETVDTARVRFVHALIRETLYEGLPILQRRTYHRRVGELLAARTTPDPDAVAYHFRQAGDERAITWLIEAGERALHAYALLSAGDRFEAALTLLEGSAEALSGHGWLFYRLAHAHRFSMPQQSIRYIDDAIRVADATGDRALAAIALSQRGILRSICGDHGRGLVELAAGIAGIEALSSDECAALAKRSGEPITGASSGRNTLTLNLAFAGRFAEALAVGEQLVARNEASSHPERVANASGYFGLAHAYARLGRATDAERTFAKARANYRSVQHHYMHAICTFIELRWLRLAYHADRIVERQQVAQEAEELLRQAESAGYDSAPRFARAPLLLVEGCWNEARADALAVLARTEAITIWRDHAKPILALLARAQGDIALAWSLIHDVLPDGVQTIPGIGYFSTAVEMQRLAAALAIDANDLPTTRVWMEAHDRWLAWSGSILGLAEGQLLWAAYHRAAGDMSQAMHHAQQALAHASDPRQPLAQLATHRTLGELETQTGDYDEAATHLGRALALAEACAAPYERALTLLALAALHGTNGESGDASRALDEARAICTRLGAKPALARADALDARLFAAASPQALHPNSLTAREVDVLRLIAAGSSNREIAATLSISTRTVNRHVENLYQKIGAHGRADATAYAFRHLT